MITYYIDSISGDDGRNGESEQNAWKKLPVSNGLLFSPGDSVLFRCGGSYPDFVIKDFGQPKNPITFGAYGIGNRPIVMSSKGPDSWISAIEINADWIVVEDFLTQNIRRAGVFVSDGSNYNVVRNVEATDVGLGIALYGQHNLATQNYIHDLHMAVNTPGGHDDHGAVGVWMSGSNNEVSYNRIVNCKAPSYDYGISGGAFEWWGIADNNYVHHNWAVDCDGFLEVGGGSAKNAVVAYNVAVNNGCFSIMHIVDPFPSEVENFRIENNTIVETGDGEQQWSIFGFGEGAGSVTKATALIRNNIVWVKKGAGPYGGFHRISNSSGFTHENNLYYIVGDIPLGFDLGVGEEIADPLFANLEERDFRLQPGSPAINRGTYLEHSLDFDDKLVPFGIVPDIGAYEYTEDKMSVVTDLQQLEIELNQRAQELTSHANSIAQIIIQLQATDDLLDAAADVIED